jgi:hypothetical protein
MADTVQSSRVPFWEPGSDAAGSTPGVQVGTPGPWESVELAGVWLPGICRVRSAKARKALVVGGAGADAEELVDTGAESSGVTITCTMWTPAHLAAFASFVEAVEMQGGTRKDPKAVDVSHPGLNMLGISSVYVTVVTVPEPGALRGTYESTIQADEWRPTRSGAAGLPRQIDASVTAIPTAIDVRASPAATEAGP